MKIVLIFFFSFQVALQAQIKLPGFFTDNMVMQRDCQIPIWGWAQPNEKITVTFHNQKLRTKSDPSGQWKVLLQPEKAGGPYNLDIKGKNKLVLKNILVGDVWLASGQSNMEWTVEQSDNYLTEKNMTQFPNIRHVKIEHSVAMSPQEDVLPTQWDVCSPETFGKFSGIGYYFAKELNQKTHLPIGILNASWGGSMIETWISRQGFESSEEFQYLNNSFLNVDFEEIKNQIIIRLEKLQNRKITEFKAEEFIQLNYDDSTLPTLIQPTDWESQSIGNVDGVIWIRKIIEISAEEAQKAAKLSLSRIDDEDITYINGIKIGENNVWNSERDYTIPPNVLKAGKNVIAIKITDTGGGGGLWGEAEKVFLQLGDKKMSLSGEWAFFVTDVFLTNDVNSFQSLTYNAMIHPLLPFPIKGIIWYQGETNAPRAYQYRTTFPLLIEDWRNKWKTELPFYYVQLATYKTLGDSNSGCDWAELREAQTMTLQVPNTGMVVTTDIGNPNDIHPTNKHDVGKRLADIALNQIYGFEIPFNNPVYDELAIKNNNQLIIKFNYVGGGLKTNGSDKILGFEIAGNDNVFKEVTGKLYENNAVVIQLPENFTLKGLRFGWKGDASNCNLFNSFGLPVVPFRTDDIKTITKGVKFELYKKNKGFVKITNPLFKIFCLIFLFFRSFSLWFNSWFFLFFSNSII